MDKIAGSSNNALKALSISACHTLYMQICRLEIVFFTTLAALVGCDCAGITDVAGVLEQLAA